MRIVLTDITGHKQTETALRENEQKFMRLFMEVPIALGVADKEGFIAYFNQKFTDVFGYTVDDVPTLNDWWLKAYPNETYRQWVLDNWNDAVAKAVKEGTDVESDEYTVTCQNGSERIVIIGGHPFEGGVLAIFNDITERKQTEQALHESEKLYHSLFENMLNGFAYCQMIFEQDQPQDFIYLSVNAAFETLTGLKGVAGKRVSEIIPGIRQSDPKLFEMYGRVSLSGKSEQFEIYLEALQQWFWISVYSPEKGYFVAVFDVITERKRTESKLAEQVEELRRWNDATMGRELRALELKREVNELLDQAGQPPRYPSAESAE